MTPETRAARDRLEAVLALFQAIIDSGPVVQTSTDPDILLLGIPRDPAADLMPLRASDLRLLLAALDGEPEGIIEFPGDMPAADIERFAAAWDAAQGPERTLALNLDNRTAVFRAKPYPADWLAGPRGQCEGCSCCVASGCHRDPDATCPTDRLGDSACPCTED